MGYKQGKICFPLCQFFRVPEGARRKTGNRPRRSGRYPHDLPKLSQRGQPAEDQGEARVRRGCSLLPAEKIGPRRPSSGFCKTKNIWGMSCCKRRLPPISWKGRPRKNNGELPKYYVENNHPAIVSREVFHRVQEEIARRKSKHPAAKKHTKTNRGKFTSKYALSERLVCGGLRQRLPPGYVEHPRQAADCLAVHQPDREWTEGVPAFPQHRGRNITQRNMESNSIPDSRETGRNFSRPFPFLDRLRRFK